jgi:hypothetical protein
VSSADEETNALPATELATLEKRLQSAFTTGNETGLHVLGYGEISSVVAWTVGEDRFACKRLPEFDGRARFERYRELFERYLRTLEDAGTPPVRSTLQALPLADGHLAVWCIQPMLPANGLLPNMSNRCTSPVLVRVVVVPQDGGHDERDQGTVGRAGGRVAGEWAYLGGVLRGP